MIKCTLVSKQTFQSSVNGEESSPPVAQCLLKTNLPVDSPSCVLHLFCDHHYFWKNYLKNLNCPAIILTKLDRSTNFNWMALLPLVFSLSDINLV